MYREIDACRVCGNTDLRPILDLGEQALTGVFPTSREQHVDSGPLQLVKCHGPEACGLVQLKQTYDSDQLYGDNYGYRSGLNPTMARHLRTKVENILEQFGVPSGGVVLDIGSNDGTTLNAFPSDSVQRVGIDPTAAKFLEHYSPGIQVVSDFFSEEVFRTAVDGQPASVVTSFSMFYDLDSPLDFMGDVHNVLSADGIWMFEQSYLPLMLERNSYDTVCHEHVEYYSLSQVAWMARQVGFTLIDVELNDLNGGSFSVTAVKSASGLRETPRVAETIEHERVRGIDGLDVYAAFARRVAESRESLLAFLSDARSKGRSVGALGASTKGNVLLQYCGLTSEDIVAIGEINEDKFGAFTPGTLIPICPEAELLALQPDYLLVLPWHFRETFMSKERAGGSRLVFPLPELEIVDSPGASPN